MINNRYIRISQRKKKSVLIGLMDEMEDSQINQPWDKEREREREREREGGGNNLKWKNKKKKSIEMEYLASF